jgi:uncharacterized membrane protein YgcG
MFRQIVRVVGVVGLLLPLPMIVRGQETQDPLAKALQRDDVYVGKTRRSQVNATALHALTSIAPHDRPLKIAVVTELSASGKQFGTRNEYTKQLHDWLGLGRGTLIIVTGRGVSAATPAVAEDRITTILKRYALSIQSTPMAGLKQTVAALDAAAKGQGAPAPVASTKDAPPSPMPQGGANPMGQHISDTGFPVLLLVPIGAVGGLLLWAGSRAAKRGHALGEARLPVERLRGEVVTGISYADTYLDLLPESPAANTARTARQRAAELYEQAAQRARQAHTPEDYGRAQALLESAKEATDECRKQIDVATGGTGFAVAVEGTDYRATPATSAGTAASQAAPVVPGLRAKDIPPAERGACFFCSRPARISDLTPITIALNGQRRKVLVCADDVRIIQHGATPEVRTVTVNGRPLPWFSARQYDPYRDYNTTYVSYMPGYGGFYDGSGFTEGLLLGTLLSEPTPMPYPMFVMPDGQVADSWQAAQSPMVEDGSTDVGGTDFYGTDNLENNNQNDNYNGSDYSAGTDTNVGSVDFSNDSNNSVSDFGSSSTDFGSSDSGGTDFSGGGSDFGGSDSSGGSDY